MEEEGDCRYTYEIRVWVYRHCYNIIHFSSICIFANRLSGFWPISSIYLLVNSVEVLGGATRTATSISIAKKPSKARKRLNIKILVSIGKNIIKIEMFFLGRTF